MNKLDLNYKMFYMKKSVGGTLDGIYKTNSKELAEARLKDGYKYISYEEYRKLYMGELAISYDYDIL